MGVGSEQFKELGAVVMAYLQAGLKDKFTQVNILFVNPIFPL